MSDHLSAAHQLPIQPVRARVTVEVEASDGRVLTYEFHDFGFPAPSPIDMGKPDPGLYFETERDFDDLSFLDRLEFGDRYDRRLREERVQLIVRGILRPVDNEDGEGITHTLKVKNPEAAT